MRNSHPSPSWRRWLVAPVMVSLVSASLLVGYAGESLWAGVTHPSRGLLRFAGFARQGDSAQSGDDATGTDDPLGNYKTTLNLLKKDYYGAPIDAKKTQQLTYDAIRGMLDTLKDQFTSFLDPDEWNQMQATTKGDFEGIGAVLQQDGADVKVVEPIENSPAEKAGLKTDDIITRVDGKSVIGKDINDVVRVIKGPKDTIVKIGVLRGKNHLEFSIKRARIEPPVVKFWMEDTQNKIGHIVLKEFNEKSVEQLDHAFDVLNKQGMRALVFDLRHNPGGLLTVAIQVASIFIPRDANKDLDNAVVWVREGTGREQSLTLHGPDDSFKQGMPFVVLTDDMSASASEIVSGAIKDYGVGTLMGERTFGKGLVQTLFPLDDRSALRLTTAKYYTPKHTDINRKHDEDGYPIDGSGGIAPDIEVKQSPKWKTNFNDKTDDTQLQKAIEFLKDRLNGMNVAQATQAVQKAH